MGEGDARKVGDAPMGVNRLFRLRHGFEQVRIAAEFGRQHDIFDIDVFDLLPFSSGRFQTQDTFAAFGKRQRTAPCGAAGRIGRQDALGKVDIELHLVGLHAVAIEFRVDAVLLMVRGVQVADAEVRLIRSGGR